ncbi:MAG: isochorismatase family protein [Thermoplasmata archaeon]|nr:isochorismatase family protein [Thermoplasmata archaeon]NIS13519.1 isochorismatase family protein [Thermoplasmata archaeon]NIS21392.1 isochorismatase family protein [Thermoplasmata archaeon]NIT78941.1 isochorismatase family protein [Thermoplasmata archaeon]NIV80157.1 isochorismatase family protein [Thermoplasmata archaeon]
MSALLGKDGTVFVVIDMQDTLLKKCHEWETVTDRCVVFLKFCHVVDMPIVATEQYPKGLGRTNLELAEAAGADFIPKTTFDCFGETAFLEKVESLEPKTLVLAGIEAHVCVLQTALDATERGYKVHVLADAVTSRASWMAQNGLSRMANAGVVVSNTESAMFEIVGDSADPLFKRMLFLVK